MQASAVVVFFLCAASAAATAPAHANSAFLGNRGAIAALPPPCGHTAQVSPSHPNGDREWYVDGAAFGRKYKPQDGEITELPKHIKCEDLKTLGAKSLSTRAQVGIIASVAMALFSF